MTLILRPGDQSEHSGQAGETKNLVTLKTTDLLSDVREKMLAAKFVSYPVLERGKYVGMMDRGICWFPIVRRLF